VTECSGSGSDRKNTTLEDMPDTKVWFESRNFSPWRYGVLPVLRGRAFVTGGLLVLSLLSHATTCHTQQVQSAQARGSTIPTLEALPHDPLPRGDFLGWCGLNDKALMGVDKMLEAVGGGSKIVHALCSAFGAGPVQ